MFSCNWPMYHTLLYNISLRVYYTVSVCLGCRVQDEHPSLLLPGSARAAVSGQEPRLHEHQQTPTHLPTQHEEDTLWVMYILIARC